MAQAKKCDQCGEFYSVQMGDKFVLQGPRGSAMDICSTTCLLARAEALEVDEARARAEWRAWNTQEVVQYLAAQQKMA